MSKRRKARETIEVRLAVIEAAAVAYSSGNYTKTEELWALCVFFERFVYLGADGTHGEFGPPEGTEATVLRLVPRKYREYRWPASTEVSDVSLPFVPFPPASARRYRPRARQLRGVRGRRLLRAVPALAP